MRYVVTGMNAAGARQQLIINAETEDEALDQAGQRGLRDPSVHLAPEHNESLGKKEAMQASRSARDPKNIAVPAAPKKSSKVISLLIFITIFAALLYAAVHFELF